MANTLHLEMLKWIVLMVKEHIHVLLNQMTTSYQKAKSE